MKIVGWTELEYIVEASEMELAACVGSFHPDERFPKRNGRLHPGYEMDVLDFHFELEAKAEELLEENERLSRFIAEIEWHYNAITGWTTLVAVLLTLAICMAVYN